MKSFFDTFPVVHRSPTPRQPMLRWCAPVILCPTDGVLGRDFKPVHVEPWAPEPRRQRKRTRRPISVERVEEINASLNWDVLRRTSEDAMRIGEAGSDEPFEQGNDYGWVERSEEDYEWDDARYFEPAEANGIRSLMQPRMSSADYSWRAPAARCRSCGCETWVASIADGIRMLSNPRHRKGCAMPPNRLEVEQSCGE